MRPRGQNYLPTAPTFTSTAGLAFKFAEWVQWGYQLPVPAQQGRQCRLQPDGPGPFLTDLTANYTPEESTRSASPWRIFSISGNGTESQVEYVSPELVGNEEGRRPSMKSAIRQECPFSRNSSYPHCSFQMTPDSPVMDPKRLLYRLTKSYGYTTGIFASK